jgi:hypothetical protein
MVTTLHLSFPIRCVALVMTAALGVSLGCGSSGGSGSGCDAYFQAVFLSGCTGGALPPESEISRIEGIFETICTNEEALPGSGVTDSVLGACAAAIQAVGCDANLAAISACTFTGSLAAGAACSDSAECESGSCDLTFGTGGSEPSCGKCGKSAAVGQPCGMTDVSCVPGSACDQSGPTGDGTCKTLTFGQVGASCDSSEHPDQQCASGLYCVITLDSGKCTALGGMGTSCLDSAQCQSPLDCPAGKCTPRSAAGGPCSGDGDCASGLGCDDGTNKCASVTWATAGASCGGLTSCLVGECSMEGKCPTVIKDGQACVETSTTAVCDTLSSCVNGKCELPGTTVCH